MIVRPMPLALPAPPLHSLHKIPQTMLLHDLVEIFVGLLVIGIMGVLIAAWRHRRQITTVQQTAPDGPTITQHGFYQEIPSGAIPTRLDHVAGIDEAKREVQEVIDFLRHPEKYHRLGARIPRGFLLYGPPGTGKTLLAKAVAGESATAFFTTSGSSFVDTYVGVGAKRIREVFAAIRKVRSPAILFIDEVDAVAKKRGPHHPEADQTLNQLLVEMDGFETAAHPYPIVIMAATNRLDTLDPAILRPGRFDRHIAVDLPDVQGRRTILATHTVTKPLAPEVSLDVLAQRTIGLSGADLENLCNEAAIAAARVDRPHITVEDFAYALDRQVAGLVSHRVVHPDDRRRVAYHETGHALLSWLNNQVIVEKITIIPHGRALGYALPVPKDERYIATADDLWHRLLGMLGGRAAELVFFGSASTGASDDFEKAAQLVKDMIHRYNLTSWGLAMIPDLDWNAIHEPVSRIVDQGMAVACEWVARYQHEVTQVAERLLAQETLLWGEMQACWQAIPQGTLPPFPDPNAWTFYPSSYQS